MLPVSPALPCPALPSPFSFFPSYGLSYLILRFSISHSSKKQQVRNSDAAWHLGSSEVCVIERKWDFTLPYITQEGIFTSQVSQGWRSKTEESDLKILFSFPFFIFFFFVLAEYKLNATDVWLTDVWNIPSEICIHNMKLLKISQNCGHHVL